MGYQVEALFDFLDNAKSIYHVVDFAKKYLLKNDFIELDLSQKFNLIQGGKYFVIQKGAIFAFRIDSLDDGCYIIGSHTDSPSIAIKSNPVIHENDYIKLNTEIYGGPILSTWFDRPLSIAGCVHIEGEDPLNPIEKLIDFEEEVCIIPNLAIHMNRDVNNGFAINKQNHMLPIISLEGDKVESDFILTQISKRLDVKKEDILSYELNLYDPQKAKLIGLNKDMISSKKIDNVAFLQASLEALVETSGERGIKIVAGFDSEEIGSSSQNGADSDILSNLIERVMLSFGKGREAYLESLEKSFMISADMAHAIHPNFKEKSDITNKPKLNQGLTIKQSANKRYTSDSKGSSIIISLCKKAGINHQIFVNRSDEAGGSTIGPISSSHLPIDAVDIGNPVLAMHSVRELCGAKDHADSIELFKTFFMR